MSHFSPLLWLCAVSAAALNSFTALDPTGAYEQYLDALGENTPAIAAFFDAAESGVFPWTIPGVSEPIPSPVPDLLPQPPEVVDPVIPDEPEEPVSQFTTVDASYFDDALFLGDSHTDGFHDYAGLGNATYFTKNGLTVKDAVEKSFIELDGKKVTLAEALGTRQFGKVYILLGINEIGAYTAADWAASTAFRSSGLMMVCMDARSRVPSGLTATLPEVSGTCLTVTRIFIFLLPPTLLHAQIAGDDHALDLAGALVKAKDRKSVV